VNSYLWCETGKRQTRDHLVKECGRWKTEINVLWTTIGKKLGWKHHRNKISKLFREEKATGAILQFLRDADIGEMKNGALRPPIPDCATRRGSGRWMLSMSAIDVAYYSAAVIYVCDPVTIYQCTQRRGSQYNVYSLL